MRLPTIETPSHVRFLCQKRSKVNISLSHPGQWRGNRWRAGWVELYKSAVLHITADWFSARLLKATFERSQDEKRNRNLVWKYNLQQAPKPPQKLPVSKKARIKKCMCIYFFLLCSMPPGDLISRQNVNFHTYADDNSIVDLYWAFVWAERTTCSVGVCTVHRFHCKFCYLFISNKKTEYKHTEYKKISVQKGTGRSKTFIIQPPFLLIDNKTVLLNQITASRYTNNCVSPENQGYKGGRTCMHASKNTNATNVSNIHSMRLTYCSTPCCLTRQSQSCLITVPHSRTAITFWAS